MDDLSERDVRRLREALKVTEHQQRNEKLAYLGRLYAFADANGDVHWDHPSLERVEAIEGYNDVVRQGGAADIRVAEDELMQQFRGLTFSQVESLLLALDRWAIVQADRANVHVHPGFPCGPQEMKLIADFRHTYGPAYDQVAGGDELKALHDRFVARLEIHVDRIDRWRAAHPALVHAAIVVMRQEVEHLRSHLATAFASSYGVTTEPGGKHAGQGRQALTDFDKLSLTWYFLNQATRKTPRVIATMGAGQGYEPTYIRGRCDVARRFVNGIKAQPQKTPPFLSSPRFCLDVMQRAHAPA